MITFDDGFRTRLLELFTWRRDERRSDPIHSRRKRSNASSTLRDRELAQTEQAERGSVREVLQKPLRRMVMVCG